MSDFTLGIIANTGKTNISKQLPEFLTWLKKQKINFIIEDELNALINPPDTIHLPSQKLVQESEFIISFGGDGTFLRTAMVVAPREVPILGVNLGAFGYLAEVAFEHLPERIRDLQEGNYQIQDRVMIEGRIERTPNNDQIVALNDIVLDKGAFPRTIRLETHVDGALLNTFIADGLIISTPTGSTGYSLSSGGPIIDPDVNILILSPICPHMLANRPIVIDGNRKVEVTVFSESGKVQVTADGQSASLLGSGEKLVVQQAKYVTKVVHFTDYSFYNLLRTKLHWRHQLSITEDDENR